MTSEIQSHKTESPSYFYRNICIAVAAVGVASIAVAALCFQGMHQPLSHWDFWVINAGTTLTVLGVIGLYKVQQKNAVPVTLQSMPEIPSSLVPVASPLNAATLPIWLQQMIPWRDLIQIRAQQQEGVNKREVCLYSRSDKLSATQKMEKQNKMANSGTSSNKSPFRIYDLMHFPYERHIGEGFAIVSTQNRRLEMEDWGFVKKDLQIGNSQAILGCCIDGHGDKRNMGPFVEAQLPLLLRDILKDKELNDKNIGDAFATAFEAMHLYYLTHICKKLDTIHGGGTLTAVLRINGFIYTANSGDSRAVRVSKNGDMDVLSIDASIHTEKDIWDYNPYFIKGHSTEEAREVCLISEGVETYLGQLYNAGSSGVRVDPKRGLNLMRSIGDPGIRCRPKITKFESGGYVLLGSDGLWGALSNEQFKEGLLKMLEQGMTLGKMAFNFVQFAYRYSPSGDNVIAVLIQL